MAERMFPKEILQDPKPLVAITNLAESDSTPIKEGDLLRQLKPRSFHLTSLKDTPFGSPSTYLAYKNRPPAASFAPRQSYDASASVSVSSSASGASSDPLSAGGSSSGAGLAGDSNGIIKYNWFQKRVELIPAAVLGFFVSEGSDQVWKSKENELASFMEAERKYFKARGIRFILILVLGSGENILTIEEKLSYLKKRVDLDTKQVIVVNSNIDVNYNLISHKKNVYSLYLIV